MSKEIPERNDLWQREERIMRILNVWELSDCIPCIEILYEIAGMYFIELEREDEFVKRSTYIGKAKGSIKDLFEVEDESV